MNNQNGKLSLDDLKVQSFATSIDEEKAQKILGGAASHPTHTEDTDTHETCTCDASKTSLEINP
ncbi:pinensin family lanthipeptide [Fulvivirga maritima]|uniref:pinensin family lanthipeptide n=1 Tax=Fulvivirga maritima TaxID=2904247 RepID=UPI001F33DF22|nr:pinensin family lanthipeptide [Fulvivirga maritima]UII26793.1 pinensin family lanthipeptide [Fulvivirga maritima]